jgi:hypothetical protein
MIKNIELFSLGQWRKALEGRSVSLCYRYFFFFDESGLKNGMKHANS